MNPNTDTTPENLEHLPEANHNLAHDLALAPSVAAVSDPAPKNAALSTIHCQLSIGLPSTEPNRTNPNLSDPPKQSPPSSSECVPSLPSRPSVEDSSCSGPFHQPSAINHQPVQDSPLSTIHSPLEPASSLLSPFPPVKSASRESTPDQLTAPEPNRTNPNLSDAPKQSPPSSSECVPSLPSRPSVETEASRSSFRRRVGKVARLPIATREKINTMLDDGLPYAEIIKSLGPECDHLNTDNIGNWVKGGYQDWLNLQEKHTFAEDFCHHIDKVDKPDDADALFEKTLRFTALQTCATLASLPRPNPDKPDYSWTRVTKDVPRLIKSFIDFRYCRDWTNPAAKADRIEREKQKKDNILNAARFFNHAHPGADILYEILEGNIKVNPDGTWYRPTKNLALDHAHALNSSAPAAASSSPSTNTNHPPSPENAALSTIRCPLSIEPPSTEPNRGNPNPSDAPPSSSECVPSLPDTLPSVKNSSCSAPLGHQPSTINHQPLGEPNRGNPNLSDVPEQSESTPPESVPSLPSVETDASTFQLCVPSSSSAEADQDSELCTMHPPLEAASSPLSPFPPVKTASCENPNPDHPNVPEPNRSNSNNSDDPVHQPSTINPLQQKIPVMRMNPSTGGTNYTHPAKRNRLIPNN